MQQEMGAEEARRRGGGGLGVQGRAGSAGGVRRGGKERLGASEQPEARNREGWQGQASSRLPASLARPRRRGGARRPWRWGAARRQDGGGCRAAVLATGRSRGAGEGTMGGGWSCERRRGREVGRCSGLRRRVGDAVVLAREARHGDRARALLLALALCGGAQGEMGIDRERRPASRGIRGEIGQASWPARSGRRWMGLGPNGAAGCWTLHSFSS